MAKLTNANSNKNYFQCHGSHYNYEKGVPLGLPISRSIFKNFLQNLEFRFIKSSSKSKALIIIVRDVREDNVHLTYLLFILSHPHCMDPADPCGNPSWSSQSFMHHHILCDLFHGIHGFQEMQVSVMTTHNTKFVHRLLSVVLRFGLQGHHGSGEGCMLNNPNQYTGLLMIHWGIHTQSGWKVLEHYLAEMTPVT